jgi:ABC-type nitrate/sulfonate/bicarbonate transport system substrate-binding protein
MNRKGTRSDADACQVDRQASLWNIWSPGRVSDASQTRSRKLVGLTIILLVVGACDVSGQKQAAGPSPEHQLESLRVVWTTEGNSYIPQAKGPIIYGPDFGLQEEASDIKEFDSHAAAVQALLSGEADIVAGSFTSFAQVAQRGIEIVSFCPVHGDSSEMIIGVGDVTKLSQLKDPDVRVGVDSAGGLVNFIMNAVFRSRGLRISVNDLKNVRILEDGSLRLARLMAGQIDVGTLDPLEKAQLERGLGAENVHVLSVTAADMNALGDSYAAQQSWLNSHLPEATAFCASVLRSDREMAGSFELYRKTSNQYITPNPTRSALRANWNLARQYQIWPYNINLLTPTVVKETIQIGVDSGLLEPSARDLSFNEIIDRRPAERALKLIGGPIRPSEVTGR